MISRTQLKTLNARLRTDWEQFARVGGSPETLSDLRQAIRDIARQGRALSVSTLSTQAARTERNLLAHVQNGFPLSSSDLQDLHDSIIGLKQLAAMSRPATGQTESVDRFIDDPLLIDAQRETPFRILIVDDQTVLLEAYTRVLEEVGMEVLGEPDPMNTIKVTTEYDPDVVLLDMTLPLVSSVDIAATLREKHDRPHMPILFLSNEDNEHYRLQALNLGADDFLIKPVSPDHLVAAVTARAQRSRHSRQQRARLQRTLYQLEREHTAVDEHAIVSVADRHGNITYVNDRFCEISAYTREELMGKNHRIIRSNQHGPDFYQDLWRTISAGRVWSGDICNQRKDGTHYWVASTITPFLDENHIPYQYVSIRTDITAVKMNAEMLRSEGELHEAINHIASRLLVMDAADLFPAIPGLLERTQAVLGSEAAFMTLFHEPILGLSASQSWSVPGRHTPIGQQLGQNWSRLRHGPLIFLRSQREHEVCPTELQQIAQDADIRSLLMLPLTHQDQPLGHVSFSHFSVERKWGEREIRVLQLLTGLITQSIVRIRAEETAHRQKEMMRRGQVFANIGTWEWNITTDELYWTERIAPLFGYEEGEVQTSYENFIRAVHPDDRELVAGRIAACLQNDELYEVEHRIVRPDGSVRWLLERGDVVRTPEGKPLRMIGVVQDIDARKQAEEQLVKARQEAERANAAKSDFLSSMSHELRTPMNVILGFAQLLEYDDTLTADQRDSTREIASAGQHLLELINDVLDLAKVESGNLSVSLEKVEIRPLIGECLLQMAPIAEDHRVTLAPGPKMESWVYADYTRLRQVLLNLLSNAIKYNRAGGSVLVTTERHESPNHLCLRVTDTGYGIERDQITRLFQPFERLDAQQTATEGTGIGLTITRRLVELMNGTIDVESTPGKGSTFRVVLPLAAGTEVPGTVVPHSRVNGHPTGTTTTPRKRILYVEDNPSNIKLIQQSLSSQGDLELLVAQSSRQGIEMALSHDPLLILLDINLPVMDGYQVLSSLKETDALPDTPIIAVTANGMPRDIERGLAAGFDDYLTKPLDIDNLIGIIRRHLGD
ncbi:MAG: response regulator [Pseudomonadota bacterium]